MKTPSWLPAASERSGQEPWSLGSAFGSYLRIEGKTPEWLREELGCSAETLQWLSLCRRPDPERFEEHVRAIAGRFRVDVDKLTKILRHAEVLETFNAAQAQDEDEEASPTLMAAQDREKDEEQE